MKRKLLLLLTVITGMVSSAWALEEVNGVYQIETAQDLADFAALVNGGETTINAVLTDDIDMSELTSWTAIGDWNTGAVTSAYCGHFDGKGYTIENFNFTSNKNYYGIFGVVSTGCLIENLIVEGTITSNVATSGVVGYARDATPTLRNIHSYLNINNTKAGARIGGILGSSVNGTIVVDRCTYSGTMDGNDGGGSGNYGGIVGYVNNNGAAHLRVTNCLFDGELKNTAATPGNCTFGGMVGYVGANPDVTITNCLSIGKLQSAITGLFYGAVKRAACSIVNSYYQGDYNINGAASGAVTPTTQQVTKVTDTQLANGETAYALNGNQSETPSWFQTLVDDDYPTPNGADIIYMNGRQHCDGTPYDGAVSYSNENSGVVIDKHNPVDGFCSYCGALDADYMTANDEGYFEIGTGNQLRWFAVSVNTGNSPANANAVLIDNIDLNGIAWTPIGNASVAYAGTFDGNNKEISNFSYTATANNGGLFGKISAATIKDFSIGGSLTIEDGKYVGVIAQVLNSTISNIHSSLTIEVTGGGSHMGGVVGSTEGGSISTISNCSFSGSITMGTDLSGSIAGVLGYMSADNVVNCANYGDISFEATGANVGGIVAYLNNANASIKNCLNTGIITCTGGTPTYGGAIIGRIKNNFTPSKLSDNYWLDGSALAAAKKDKTDGDVLPSTKKVTSAQLASGEVAYNLGQAFRQNIGTDAAPVLDTTHAVVGKITAAGYATLYVADTDVEIPAGVEAFAAEFENTWLKLNAISDAIAAGEPVVLKGDEGYYSFAPTTGAVKATDNVLKGTAEEIDAAGKYVLAKPAEKAIGFYLAESGKIAAGKAYLEVPGTEVKGFIFAEDGETGIVSPLGETEEGVIYNLAGQRINKLQKGINIVGGKKVLF